MGCGMSTEEREGKARNEEIDNQLKRDRMQQRNEIKMLHLGTSTAAARRVAAALAGPRDAAPLTGGLQVLANPANPPSSSR